MTIDRLAKSILTLNDKYAKETKAMKTQEGLNIQSKLMQRGVELFNAIVTKQKVYESLDDESRAFMVAIQTSVAALNTKNAKQLKEMTLADGIEHWDTIHYSAVALALKITDGAINANDEER